jgi:hypothetical protein
MIPDVEEFKKVQDFQDFFHAGCDAVKNQGDVALLKPFLYMNQEGYAGRIGIGNFSHIDNNTSRRGFIHDLIDDIPKGKTVGSHKGILNPDQKVIILDLGFDIEIQRNIIPTIVMRNGGVSPPFIGPASSAYGRHIFLPSIQKISKRPFLPQ